MDDSAAIDRLEIDRWPEGVDRSRHPYEDAKLRLLFRHWECRLLAAASAGSNPSGHHTYPLPQGTNPTEVKSLHPFEKFLELRMVPKQLTSCLHKQVCLVPRQYIGCRDLFQIRPKAWVCHLVKGQIENMELDILAVPPLAIADNLA